MAKTILAAQTGAATVYYDAHSVQSFVVMATNLAGGEEIDIAVEAGTGVYETATDIHGIALKLTGTAGTNNAKQMRLEGGLVYRFTKDVTATASEIRVAEGQGMNQ